MGIGTHVTFEKISGVRNATNALPLCVLSVFSSSTFELTPFPPPDLTSVVLSGWSLTQKIGIIYGQSPHLVTVVALARR